MEEVNKDVYVLACDKCGDHYQQNGHDVMFYEHDGWADEEAMKDNWIVSENADYYCPHCAYVDEKTNRIHFYYMASSGAEIIAAERQRQIDIEGWDAEHDDKHEKGELADAACCYAMTEDMRIFLDNNWGTDMWLTFWPFELPWLKRTQLNTNTARIKDLAKAGALVAAEIDRLQREINKGNE